MLFKLKCGVAFELLVRVAREHVNLNAFTVLLVSICVWVRWFSQEENKRKNYENSMAGNADKD